MNRRQSIGVVGMMVFAFAAAWAQDTTAPSPDAQGPQQPVPAYGQENAPAPISENPPLSGLDLPSLQEHAAPLSYLQPGANISESANTNIGNTLGGNSVGSITRALGDLTLRRLWSHYDLALDYAGGIGYYNKASIGLRMMQNLGLQQKIEWKRGQLLLRDSFSYLPEGNFGGAYGSLGSAGLGSMGGTIPGMSEGGLGALGLTPRILNISQGEISENLNPKSAVTATGGYSFTHFYGTDAGRAFIGSSQVSAQTGYNRILTSHTQVAVSYGYQAFDFTLVGTAFHTHVVQGMYGHRISGRMDLLLGTGPQFTYFRSDVTAGTSRLGVAAQARLRYRFSRSSVDLRYLRTQTNGAGLFAGAQSDIIRFGFEHPLSRVWSLSTDLGYSRNGRVQPLTDQQKGPCGGSQQTACPAGDARTYNSGFAGAALHRQFGREFHGYMSYQFNELSFDHSYCTPNVPCSRISNRQVATFGLDWTPRPIRID